MLPALTLLALLVALTACGGGAPRETLEQIASGAATTALVASELRAHHVTARYAGRTLAKVGEQLDTDAGSLKVDALPAATRAAAVAAVADARRSAADAARAVERRDTTATIAAGARAAAAQHAIDGIVASLPAS